MLANDLWATWHLNSQLFNIQYWAEYGNQLSGNWIPSVMDHYLFSFFQSTFHKVDPNKPPPTIACQVCKAACASKAHLALHMLQAHSSFSSQNNKDEKKMLIMPTFSLDYPVEKPAKPVKPANPVKLANPVKPASPVKPAYPLSSTATSCLTPYPCCLCDKILYSRLHLETHTRVHTQEKPLGKKEGFPCEDTGCAAAPGVFLLCKEIEVKT